MAIPESSLTILDGALGLVSRAPTAIQAKVGISSSGDFNTLETYTDPKRVVEDFGSGPLVEAACLHLNVAGGPLHLMRINGSVAGTKSAVTKTGTSTATAALTGTPYDTYDAIVELTRGGATLAAATAAFRYSLDGGRTYSPEYAMPASGVFVIPDTGLTITWTYSSGTGFVAGDTYTFTTVAPGYSLSDLNTTIDALLADPAEWSLLHVVGAGADASTMASMLATLDARLESAAEAFRYVRAFIESPPTATAAALKAATLSIDSLRVGIIHGTAYVTSVVTGYEREVSAAAAIMAHASRLKPSEDLGKVMAGKVRGVSALVYDERSGDSMDDARYTTLRTHVGLGGAYVTNARMLASEGSDFIYLQNGRVMDVASRTIRIGSLRFLNADLRVDEDEGTLLETEAAGIESYLKRALEDALVSPGYASAVGVEVDRNENILSTGTLRIKYRVTPLAYAKSIENEVGFYNPALQAS